jgi:hypothetical protein
LSRFFLCKNGCEKKEQKNKAGVEDVSRARYVSSSSSV